MVADRVERDDNGPVTEEIHREVAAELPEQHRLEGCIGIDPDNRNRGNHDDVHVAEDQRAAQVDEDAPSTQKVDPVAAGQKDRERQNREIREPVRRNAKEEVLPRKPQPLAHSPDVVVQDVDETETQNQPEDRQSHPRVEFRHVCLHDQ